ncbi:MAG: peptidoglycan DD-metalloendopeptidase family protein [Muribaculaceae bacterium]|nr:peptidoglycan DD-metalloendopeptidase family protein [Muribaculaceae bacterium]
MAAVLVASSFAARADEISDLVAIVAGSTAEKRLNSDIITAGIDSDKPRYIPQSQRKSVDVFQLDGILKAMKRQLSKRSLHSIQPNSRPTLARPGFFRPVPGIITSHFGWRPQFQRVHHGIDLRLNIGDTVRAAMSGEVTKISYDHDGYGHYVVLKHPDSMETVYGHLQYALVSQGQYVSAGQPLAIGGNTGNSTGPHLHFETRLDGIAIDPTILFDFYGNSIYIAEEQPKTDLPQGPVFSHQTKSLADESTYIVRYGDTLQSIARQAGISVMRLCQLNMLQQSSEPEIGRMLKLK